MACKLIWSQGALDDLRDLVRYIAAGHHVRAASFGLQLIRRIERLQELPELGRVVPERHNPAIRELVVAPYRVVYRFAPTGKVVEILRIWHGARGEPPEL